MVGVRKASKVMRIVDPVIKSLLGTKNEKYTMTKRVNAKLDYKAVLSSLSLLECREIDKIINGMDRKITKDMAAFPMALLYKLGELGTKDFRHLCRS